MDEILIGIVANTNLENISGPAEIVVAIVIVAVILRGLYSTIKAHKRVKSYFHRIPADWDPEQFQPSGELDCPVESRLEMVFYGKNSNNLPKLSELHSMTVRHEHGQNDNSSSRLITHATIIGGIFGTALSVTLVIFLGGENVNLTKFQWTLVPSGVAVLGTVILLWARAVYLKDFSRFLHKLDSVTATRILPKCITKLPIELVLDRFEGVISELSVKVQSLEDGYKPYLQSVGNVESAISGWNSCSKEYQSAAKNLTKVLKNLENASNKMSESYEKVKAGYDYTNTQIDRLSNSLGDITTTQQTLKTATADMGSAVNALHGNLQSTGNNVIVSIQELSNSIQNTTTVVDTNLGALSQQVAHASDAVSNFVVDVESKRAAVDKECASLVANSQKIIDLKGELQSDVSGFKNQVQSGILEFKQQIQFDISEFTQQMQSGIGDLSSLKALLQDKFNVFESNLNTTRADISKIDQNTRFIPGLANIGNEFMDLKSSLEQASTKRQFDDLLLKIQDMQNSITAKAGVSTMNPIVKDSSAAGANNKIEDIHRGIQALSQDVEKILSSVSGSVFGKLFGK